MEKKRQEITVEPDYEEFADIPETISQGMSVDENGLQVASEKADYYNEKGVLEERTDYAEEFSDPQVIADEFSESEITEEKDHRIEEAAPDAVLKDETTSEFNDAGDGDDIDIGSFAAQIDLLTRREQPRREMDEGLPVVPAGETPAVLKEPKEQSEEEAVSADERKEIIYEQDEHEGEIVIFEEDDIDIDYYSIEEISGTVGGSIEPVDLDAYVHKAKAEENERGEGTSQFAQAPEEIKDDYGKVMPDREKPAEVSEKDKAKELKTAKIKSHAKPENAIVIEISEELRKKLPEDFDIGELGNIDLNEAEEIANEGIVLLTENELIEELEEFDLLPIQEKSGGGRTKTEEEDVLTFEKKETADQHIPDALDKLSAEPEDTIRKAPSEDIPSAAEPGSEKQGLPGAADETASESAEERADGTIDEKYIPAAIEEDMTADTTETFNKTEEEKTEEDQQMSQTVVGGTADGVEMVLDGSETGELPHDTEKVDLVREGSDEGEVLVEMKYSTIPDKEAEEISIIESFADEDEREKRERGQQKVTNGYVPALHEEAVPFSEGKLKTGEKIPAELFSIDGSESNVLFVDDELVTKPETAGGEILSVDELERISSQIIQVVEGEARLMTEGDSAHELDKVAGLIRGNTPVFKDLLADTRDERAYRDEEIDFINDVFEAEDYGKYIQTIDDHSRGTVRKSGTLTLELLGLEKAELTDLESNIFFKEYEKINLDELGNVRAGLDQPVSDFKMTRKLNYITSLPDSLTKEEKKSIEEDIGSGSALIFEENIDEVKKRLKTLKGSDEGISREVHATGRKEEPRVTSEIEDISNNVFIIEDEEDINRFISTIPEEKRRDIAKLLKYLDGIFEKLPEDVIKSFAASEYYDLYAKVLGDLGV